MGARPDATPLLPVNEVRFGVGCLPPTSSAASDHRKPRQRKTVFPTPCGSGYGQNNATRGLECGHR
jgi:hypothetical protein